LYKPCVREQKELLFPIEKGLEEGVDSAFGLNSMKITGTISGLHLDGTENRCRTKI